MRAHNFKDITGNKYWRLKVIGLAYIKDKKTYWACVCVCGKRTVVYSSKLKSGHTKSCGCLFLDTVTKHGDHKTRLYRIWHRMKSRCGKDKNYLTIKITPRWNKFENFKEDMVEGYRAHVKQYGEKQTTINRLDNKKGYSKANCEWATYKKQNNNTSFNRIITYNKESRTLSEWKDLTKPTVTKSTYRARILSGKNPYEAAK